MRQIYSEKEANYPRLKTDKLFADYGNIVDYTNYIDRAIKFIEDFQLVDTQLWARFVEQFRMFNADGKEGGWRGEYWGKMMRGACFTYSYTRNPQLYKILTDTVKDMMSVQEENGRISSYSPETEFDAWDMWSRKYVLLGMQYYLEICEDDALKKEIIDCMVKQVDYLIERIGYEEDGKKPITSCTRHWRGLNASSILEPIVRLYTLTNEQRIFDFATYIVNEGGMDVVNIFDLAYENKLSPYQYPATKAYEMTSCFEGLLEYYRITGIEKYKTAVINYANKILENDFTIIGSSGCTHELFDHSTVRQANSNNNDTQQETCVTVTLMKFFYQLTLLTGESKYVDAFETSMYNAYLGSINTNKISRNSEFKVRYEKELEGAIFEPLPCDSYSPLTAGKRGMGVGGLRLMADNHFYGCCACIGAAGTGLIPKMALLTSESGFAYNLFIAGTMKSVTPSGNNVVFNTKTEYPKYGNVVVTLELEKAESFEISIRNPKWSKTTSVTVNGKPVEVTDGFVVINREWENGDIIEVELDMRTRAIFPISHEPELLINKVIWGKNYMIPTLDEEDPLRKYHVALLRGPVVLAQDNRLGYCVDDPVDIKIKDDGFVDAIIPETESAPYEHEIEVQVPLTDGTMMTLTDYSSAGKTWEEDSKMAAWILTKSVLGK